MEALAWLPPSRRSFRDLGHLPPLSSVSSMDRQLLPKCLEEKFLLALFFFIQPRMWVNLDRTVILRKGNKHVHQTGDTLDAHRVWHPETFCEHQIHKCNLGQVMSRFNFIIIKNKTKYAYLVHDI